MWGEPYVFKFRISHFQENLSLCRLPSFPQHMACSANHSENTMMMIATKMVTLLIIVIMMMTLLTLVTLLIIEHFSGKGSGHGSQHGPTGLIVGPNAWLQRKVSLNIIISTSITVITIIFSVTRRSRSNVSESLSHSMMVSRLYWCDSGEWGCLLETWLMWLWWVRMPSRDLTDATLLSDDAT